MKNVFKSFAKIGKSEFLYNSLQKLPKERLMLATFWVTEIV